MPFPGLWDVPNVLKPEAPLRSVPKRSSAASGCARQSVLECTVRMCVPGSYLLPESRSPGLWPICGRRVGKRSPLSNQNLIYIKPSPTWISGWSLQVVQIQTKQRCSILQTTGPEARGWAWESWGPGSSGGPDMGQQQGSVCRPTVATGARGQPCELHPCRTSGPCTHCQRWSQLTEWIRAQMKWDKKSSVRHNATPVNTS